PARWSTARARGRRSRSPTTGRSPPPSPPSPPSRSTPSRSPAPDARPPRPAPLSPHFETPLFHRTLEHPKLGTVLSYTRPPPRRRRLRPRVPRPRTRPLLTPAPHAPPHFHRTLKHPGFTSLWSIPSA